MADSIEGLNAEIMARLMSSMSGRVSDIVKNKLSRSAQNRATGGWSRGGGGISDIGEMRSEVSSDGLSVTLTVTDEASPQESVFGTEINTSDPTLFSEWIEWGDWMELSDYINDGVKNKRPARPFVEPAQAEINSDPSAIINALKKNLE